MKHVALSAQKFKLCAARCNCVREAEDHVGPYCSYWYINHGGPTSFFTPDKNCSISFTFGPKGLENVLALFLKWISSFRYI
jgi:hypothetical protein